MHHSIPAVHAQHDLDLIAGHAAGDLSGSDLSRADLLITSCTSCADLRRDLVAIASATRSIPAPTAPRDFRLTQTQAASLRRGGWLKSLLRPFAAPSSGVRPVAMAFTSLGLAGLFVANILPALFGSAGAAPAPAAGPAGEFNAQGAASAAPAVPAATAAAAPVPDRVGPQATDGRSLVVVSGAGQPTAALNQVGGGSKSWEATAAPGDMAGEAAGSPTEQPYAADRLALRERSTLGDDVNPIFVGSLALLAIGLGLFALRFVARRGR